MGMPLEIDSLEELEENKVLKIKIYGEAYDGVIDATVASAIIEIQNRIGSSCIVVGKKIKQLHRKAVV